MHPCRPSRTRAGRTVWAVLGFLVLFAVLLVLVSHYYLLPALARYPHATAGARRKMSADALLLAAVLLVILFCGLLLTFRPGRFFFPRPPPRRTRTRVVDAWAEAGRRAAGDGVGGAEAKSDEDAAGPHG